METQKTAIVTGAKQGIGKGIALSLAKEGYNIVISDLDQKSCEEVAKEIESLGVKAIGIKCDVSLKSDVENLIAKTMETFGRIDVLVNNAGIYPFKSFMEMEETDFEKVMAVNVKSVFLCSKAAAKVMNEGGKIIDISSIASFIGFEGLTHYCASKGAINSFIRALALELAPKKITVNAIAPGAIETPGASGVTTEESRKQTISMIPLKRMGQPEDIGSAVAFLASEKASYITGQTIIVDGGWTLR